MINLLVFNSIDDLFLIYKFNSVRFRYNSKLFITKFYLKNTLKENELKKFCILLNNSNLLEKEINLSLDRYLVNLIADNFNNITNICNSKKIHLEDLDYTESISNLWSGILLFMNTRIKMINNKNFIKILEDTINSEVFNLNDFERENDLKILEKFYQYPEIINKSFFHYQINHDFKRRYSSKKKNLYKYLNVLEKEIDRKTPEILDLIDKKYELFINNSLFKYAYHGIPNRDLFLRL